ncbi:MAG: hypothetical protein QF918_07275 [Pirellulaceae bacterium]|nr:hypothetical protein [Pirellulaceae bacterium]
MSRHRNNHRTNRQRRPLHRRGLTLMELMMVTTILVMMAGAMAALATVVQSGSDFNHANGVVTQYGRVALERIERAVSSATANAEFPGCFVYSEQFDEWNYPDTLIVWHPTETAADPSGLPMIDELVVFCANPESPSELLEIRLSDVPGAVPALDDNVGWQMLLTEFKFGNTAKRVPLTDLLRTAAPTNGHTVPERGAVRFDVRLRPSAAEWSEFQRGTRDWDDLSWAQSIHGSGTGLRQTWCRIELQLQMEQFLPAGGSKMGTSEPGVSGTGADTTTPFFGSATVYHELHRS